ncbi:hypothetical protein M758_12G105200 [Ceratodon purpureus]|uniref:RING-type E3 ubiquitin transferase n=1 Tax=Ceratodon purpureus TaxID=3225 RepID=A0A8T0GBB6_CERPU|nr:hypothetical protein KC19_12G101400 [Ceratodon purpureus]KAG0598845.1 hypothetical protein M758_12G105200 [Ceratodon purpureus]
MSADTVATPPAVEQLNHPPPSYQNGYPSVLPPQRPPTPPSSSGGTHINPSVVVIVVILSVVFILSGFLHLLARCLGRRRQPAPRHHSPLVSALHGQLQHLFHLHDAGVEQVFIDTLPVFSYGSIRGLKDSADCAVCLTEFGDDDRLRLLPKCKHAFHLECIDTWLLSNSTCPLCRRSLLPDPHVHGGASTSGAALEATGSASDLMRSNRFICPRLSLEEQLVRDSRRIQGSLHGSIHGSYQNSFRICDVEETEDHDSENEIQEIHEQEELHQCAETPSPFAPTIRVMDEHGAQRVLKVELGKVSGKVKNVDSRKLTRKGGRSYSMGSYEYIVDPSSWELMIAPTPYPGRPQDWASSKPTHRSALSDSIPELASAGTTPANDELFWASRGLYTPHTLSRVRELLTPIGSEYSNAAFSPAAFLEYPYSPNQGDRWIDIDIERGEIVEEDDEEDEPDNWSSSEEAETARSKSFSNASLGSSIQTPLGKESTSEFKQRSSSLSRLPEGKVSVSWYRRSLSETSVGLEQAVKELELGKGKSVWEDGAAAVDVVAASSTDDQQSVKQGSFSRRFSLNWLMGRDKRVVFSAASPSPGTDPEQRTRPITI